MRNSILLAAATALGIAIACTKALPTGNQSIPVASVAVTLPASSLVVGQAQTAVATLKDDHGALLTGRSVSWHSSNAQVSSVDGNGLVTALSSGTAMIEASSEGVSGDAMLSVSPVPPAAVASVSVAPNAATIHVGGTTQLSATTRDASGTVLSGRTITWSSSNTGAATVNGSGVVSAIAVGTATITATSEGKSGSSVITVTASAPSPTLLFSDDWESGNLSKWDESNSTTQKVIHDAASAHGGSYFLRMTYGINGMDGQWLQKYFFTQGYTKMYVRYYVRFSTNWVGVTKMVSLRGAPLGDPYAGVGRAGICPTGQNSFSANLLTDYNADDGFPTKMYTYWQDMWADPVVTPLRLADAGDDQGRLAQGRVHDEDEQRA
jgi:hypothetical protein